MSFFAFPLSNGGLVSTDEEDVRQLTEQMSGVTTLLSGYSRDLLKNYI